LRCGNVRRGSFSRTQLPGTALHSTLNAGPVQNFSVSHLMTVAICCCFVCNKPKSNCSTAVSTWNCGTVTRKKQNCTSVRRVVNGTQQHVRDRRLYTAQTTVKVNCNLCSPQLLHTYKSDCGNREGEALEERKRNAMRVANTEGRESTKR
jgi:hypothetical protein